MGTVNDVLHELVLPKLDGIRRSGAGYSALCPAHEDRNPSLSVSAGKEQPVVLHCQAGCDRDDILAALGLTWEQVCKPRDRADRPTVIAIYEYTDERGQVLFIKERRVPKDFRVRRPDGRGGWTWSLGDTRRVLYRLPEITEAIRDGRTVYLVEGEKDVHAAERAGAVATCNFDGAAKQGQRPKWRPEYGDTLKGAHVVIVADNDEAGMAHARAAYADLDGKATSVRVVRGLVDAEHADLSDHLAAGHALDQLAPVNPRTTAAIAHADQHADVVVRAAGLELDAFLSATPPDHDWLVPGLIERRDRTIVTAGEGHGKSTWLRQMGVQFASGIHPFGGEDFKPLRVLLFDLENSERQVHRKISPLRAKAGDRYAGGMVIRVRPEGLDLSQGEGAILEAEVEAAHPDVLIIGPLYRLADEESDNPARAAKIAMGWLDKMRITYDCALFLEAHSPHGESGKRRPTRPYGSSQWLRWPEFGIHLAETGIITHWRGARDERDWPAAVQRGGEWPWSPATRPRDVVWARIAQLCTEAGDQLSQRDLAGMVGASLATVNRAIKEHEAEWERFESAGRGGETGW